MKKRMANMELLRIVAMMMVVLLHYLSKGAFLSPLTGEMQTNGYVAWLMEAFAIVAVNVYMLLSGYFLVESGFRPGRLVELVCQVLFYTVMVPVVLVVCGILPVGDITVYQILQYVFPTQMLHYWFVSAYILMYLFVPILSAGAKALSQKQLQITIALLIAVLAVSKSLIPVKLELDNLGYDAIWFMCVFLVAAYIRLYGIPFFDRMSKGIICYVCAALAIFAGALGVRALYLKTGSLGDFIQATYSYNHIFVLFASVALFYAFYYLQISEESKFGKFVCKISPHTFGVYLLHEQVEVRWLWPTWLGADPGETVGMMIFRALCAVLVVFAVGICVDGVRGYLFGVVKRIWRKTSLYARLCSKK